MTDKIQAENDALELIGLSDGELDAMLSDIEAKTAEEIAQKAIDEQKKRDEEKRMKKLLAHSDDAYSDSRVLRILLNYPGISNAGNSHWSLTLMNILARATGFKPNINRVANQEKAKKALLAGGFDTLPALSLVQNHLSEAIFDDIDDHVAKWVMENPDYAETAPLVNDSDSGFKIENNAESSAEPDWGCW